MASLPSSFAIFIVALVALRPSSLCLAQSTIIYSTDYTRISTSGVSFTATPGSVTPTDDSSNTSSTFGPSDTPGATTSPLPSGGGLTSAQPSPSTDLSTDDGNTSEVSNIVTSGATSAQPTASDASDFTTITSQPTTGSRQTEGSLPTDITGRASSTSGGNSSPPTGASTPAPTLITTDDGNVTDIDATSVPQPTGGLISTSAGSSLPPTEATSPSTDLSTDDGNTPEVSNIVTSGATSAQPTASDASDFTTITSQPTTGSRQTEGSLPTDITGRASSTSGGNSSPPTGASTPAPTLITIDDGNATDIIVTATDEPSGPPDEVTTKPASSTLVTTGGGLSSTPTASSSSGPTLGGPSNPTTTYSESSTVEPTNCTGNCAGNAGLSGGEIAGIVIGSVAAVALLGGGVGFAVYHFKGSSSVSPNDDIEIATMAGDPTVAINEEAKLTNASNQQGVDSTA